MHALPPPLSAPFGCPDGEEGKERLKCLPSSAWRRISQVQTRGGSGGDLKSPSGTDVCWPGLAGELSRAVPAQAAFMKAAAPGRCPSDLKRAMLGPCTLVSSGTCSPRSDLTTRQSGTWLTLGRKSLCCKSPPPPIISTTICWGAMLISYVTSQVRDSPSFPPNTC